MTTTIGSVDLNALSDLYNDANQYFWFESNPDATYGAGVHITLSPDTSFVANPSGQNVLINTDGISFRDGLLPMMTLDNDSLDFNVINTTAGTYNNVASFGSTAIVIGEEAKANMRLTFNNLSMLNKENSVIFEVGDLRDSSGVATLLFYSKLHTDTNGVVTIDFHVNINSIVSVVVNNVTISSSEYSFDGSCITITGLEKWVSRTFEITYTTLSSVPYLTFGTRDNSGKIGYFSSIEGDNLIASGFASHSEGSETKTFYAYSHAEGQLSYARGQCSHAEGFNTIAYGYMAHSEGENTEAHGNESHAEGNHTYAGGKCSHAEGYYTIAGSDYQHVSGKYNEEDYNGLYAFIIGNGTSEEEPSNAFAVDWSGNATMKGGLTLGTALSIANGGTGATSLVTVQENLGIKANSERIATIATDLNVQKSRIDTFTSLPEGSTSGNAELADIRVGADGTTYDTAGNAVRGQVNELSSDLLHNIHNCLRCYNKQDKTYGGVTYTYNGDETYTIAGSQTGTTYLNLTEPNGMPAGIIPGETYFYNFNDPTGTVSLDAWCDSTRLFYSTKPGFFTVPNNAQSLYFRLTTWNAENINTTVKIPIVSTLKTLASDSISLPPDFYGESGSNSTLSKALSIASKVKLLSGKYNVAVPLNIPESTTLEGVGVDATIINFTASTGTLITCESGNECIKNLTISGGLTEKPSIYAGATIKRGIVVQSEVNKPTYIENIKVLGFSKDGILVQNRGYISLCSIIANNIFMQYNGAGITFYEKGEYGVLTNSIAIDNYYGIIDSGGNNKISNCGFDRNTKGLYAGAVNNDTHSDVIGCSFNHCTSIGVECDGINSILTFTACQFFGATEYEIFIYNAQAVSFVNCEFGINAKLAFNKASKGDNFYALNNCIFGSTPNAINADVGTLLLITNCYTQNGIEVTN